MLTATVVASMLGLSPRAVYELHAAGRLPGYRFGRAVRFDPADVETFRLSCRSAGTPATNAGATNSTVSLKVAGTGLADYFQKAGLKPKLTRSTARKAADSTPLRLVSSDETA